MNNYRKETRDKHYTIGNYYSSIVGDDPAQLLLTDIIPCILSDNPNCRICPGMLIMDNNRYCGYSRDKPIYARINEADLKRNIKTNDLNIHKRRKLGY